MCLHLPFYFPSYENQLNPTTERYNPFFNDWTDSYRISLNNIFRPYIRASSTRSILLFLAYFGIFNLIGDGGFGGAAVKRISEGKEPDEFLSAFVFIRILLLTLSVRLLLFAEPYFKDLTSSGVFFWLLLALIVSVFSSTAATGVYGSGKVGISQISGFIDVLLRIIFQIIGVFLGFGVAGLAGGFVGGLIAGGIANFKYLELKLVRFKYITS